MKKILLRNAQTYVLVDNSDFDYLNQWRWHLKSTGYAVRRILVDGKRKTIYMHRLINETPDNLFTDHINRNRLDNQKRNLRNVSWKENRNNISGHKDSKSKERNIHIYRDKWEVHIVRFKKTIFRRLFETVEDAIKARDHFYGSSTTA